MKKSYSTTLFNIICLQKNELYSSLCQQLSFSAQSLLDDIWCRLYSTSRVLQISTKDFWYIYEHLVKKKFTCIFEHIHGSSPIQYHNLKSYVSVPSSALQQSISKETVLCLVSSFFLLTPNYFEILLYRAKLRRLLQIKR